MSTDNKSPEASSPLHLLHRAGQFADEIFAASIGKSDLTPRQFSVINSVAHVEDPSQTQLVAMTGIDRSTLADIVRRLVERGLLQRKRSKDDARMYAVRLTASGRSALAQAEPAARKTDARLLEALPVAQRTAFINGLKAIIKSMDETEVEAPVAKAPSKKRKVS